MEDSSMLHFQRIMFTGMSLCVSLFAVAGPGGTQYEYEVLGASVAEIGTLGGSWSRGLDINSAGAIVGSAANASEQHRAFYFYNGNMTDVSLGAGVQSASAFGINAHHEVVGDYTLPGEAVPITRPFYWKPGLPFTSLALLSGAVYPHAFARAINDAGRIAGSATGNVVTADGACSQLIPVTWVSSTSDPMPIRCPSHGYVSDINNDGSVVGTNQSAYPHLFRYIDGEPTATPQAPPVRGLEIESNGEANAINDENFVVGSHFYSDPNRPNDYDPILRAFYWSSASTTSTLIGPLAGGRMSRAHDINTQRMVVGEAETNPYGFAYYKKAFIWHRDFGLQPLPSLPAPPYALTTGARKRVG
jgi:probable HAF family extracellular repeat protein